MSRSDLVDSLVNLAGAMQPLDSQLSREAGARLGHAPLPWASAIVLAELRRRRTATVRQLATVLDQTTGVVRSAMADLERRGLVSAGESTPRPALQSFGTTQAAEELASETRRRAAHHLGYALASIGSEDVVALERAAAALQSLAAAIGYEGESGLPDQNRAVGPASNGHPRPGEVWRP